MKADRVLEDIYDAMGELYEQAHEVNTGLSNHDPAKREAQAYLREELQLLRDAESVAATVVWYR